MRWGWHYFGAIFFALGIQFSIFPPTGRVIEHTETFDSSRISEVSETKGGAFGALFFAGNDFSLLGVETGLSRGLFRSDGVVYSKDKAALDPVGYWQITGSDGTAHAVLRMFRVQNKLYGEIVKLFVKKGEDPCKSRCKGCRGWMRGHPICGILLLRNLENRGDYWGGGWVLDPSSGKSYRCWVRVLKGGKVLEVHGYIGISLFGKSQYWPRVKPPSDMCADTCRRKWRNGR